MAGGDARATHAREIIDRLPGGMGRQRLLDARVLVDDDEQVRALDGFRNIVRDKTGNKRNRLRM